MSNVIETEENESANEFRISAIGNKDKTKYLKVNLEKLLGIKIGKVRNPLNV